MPEPKYTHTLLAMLGGQPQVVTFTLDLLLRHDFPIREVIVIHPHAAQPRLQHSLACLNAEFVGDCYRFDDQAITCHFRPKVLELDAMPLDDIASTLVLSAITSKAPPQNPSTLYAQAMWRLQIHPRGVAPDSGTSGRC